MSSLYSHVTFDAKWPRLWSFRAPPLREVDCQGWVWINGVRSDGKDEAGTAGDGCPCSECCT